MNDSNEKRIPVEVSDITSKVKAIFEIQSITLGGVKQAYRVQYAGRLTGTDSESAYDRLAGGLSPMGLTPLFRESAGVQKIIIVDQRPQGKLGPIWVNILLFVLTLLSVMFTGAQFAETDIANPFQLSLVGFFGFLLQGWPFAISLLGILLAHEFGHYLVGRAQGEVVTLPYFIPFPFSAFGTMGAFISMKEIPKNRKHLMDIGIAGPMIGLLVAIPVLFIGLNLSTLGPIEADLPEGYVQFLYNCSYKTAPL